MARVAKIVNNELKINKEVTDKGFKYRFKVETTENSYIVTGCNSAGDVISIEEFKIK